MLALGRAPCDEAVIRASEGDGGCSAEAKPWVLAATILGSSLAFIDSSVINVALPAIQAKLAVSVQAAQWVINAYLLTLGALILVGGAAGDRFGRRRVFVLGIILFIAASMVCGLAPSAAILIVARAAQGIGGAMLVPESLAIISAAFPAEERGKAIGTWAGFSALTTALGPVLGGALVDTLSWRAVFFINLPLALLALAITFRHVPESRADVADAVVDWRGGALATLGLAGLAYGATAASEAGWADPSVVGPLLGGIAVLGMFAWLEARAASPMIPLDLFRSRIFAGANAMTLLLYAALGGALFFLPFDLIRLQGYSAAQAGATFLPFSLIMGGLSRWAGALVDRCGARLPLVVGPVIAACGLMLLAVPGIGGSYWTNFFPAMVVLGLGMTISVAPLTATVMGAVDQRRAGTASGINNAVARIAGMLAVALFGAMAVGIFRTALDLRLDRIGAAPELARAMEAQASRLLEATVPANVTGEIRQTLEAAIDDAFLRAFRAVMLTAAGLALASAFTAALTVDGKRGRALRR
ncbi:MAG TPA: MFS transporter [Stellaceae bacterium]|jgi:EmrB/QacA subfamily drug resistance transporter|nr:MFS transporter [Stellaceae bacterium]